MKRFLQNGRPFILVCILSTLFSCKSVQQMQEDRQNAREKDRKSFVQKTDGEIIEANEARLRQPLFGKSTIELDQDQRIPLRDIRAYQNNEAYYLRTPLGFSPRIKKGLINVYLATEMYTTYEAPSGYGRPGGTRTHTRYVYYLQKGNDAEVEQMQPKVVERYVQDYAPAMEYVNMYFQTQKKVKTWSIINTAAVFGGLVVASQGIGGNNLNAAGYAGAGLFIGGLVNGFVNKIRRVKNVRNLELAVDEYNFQTRVKKRK
jgi:hypothetical protein